MNIKAEVSFEISTGLPALLYLVERRVGRSKFVRNLESQKTLKLGSFEFLCLVLLQVAKCFVLVQKFIYIVAQSICTHYSCFENQGRFVTLKKKLGILLFSKSRVQKTRVVVIQKEKKQPGLFSF